MAARQLPTGIAGVGNWQPGAPMVSPECCLFSFKGTSMGLGMTRRGWNIQPAFAGLYGCD